MFKITKEEIEISGKKITLETGKIARQADGAIIATCGETVVIATVVGAKEVKEDQDYFPLSVNYQEKYYAAGKIPGGYFKREARPTEAETLISRLIDRPIRPLFPDSFLNEVQVLPTVLSYDGENQPDILSMIASSAALAISGLPFQGPIAASRVGFKDGKYLLNPSPKELEESKSTRFKYVDQKLYYDVLSNILNDTGIKTRIIKKYLPVINKHVNDYLKDMDFFVNFQLDENFQETIKSRHRDQFSYYSFSEGEKKRIDIALLLTWRDIASMRNSVNVNLLILDEVFDASLDQAGVDDLMKLFNILKNTNLFIISHKLDILDDKFPSKLIVEKVKNFTQMVRE